MSLFQPLNEGKRVSYKKYMGIGAGLGIADNFAKNAYYNSKYGDRQTSVAHPFYGFGNKSLAVGGALGGAATGAALAFARNHSKKIDNILRLRSPFRKGIEYDRDENGKRHFTGYSAIM